MRNQIYYIFIFFHLLLSFGYSQNIQLKGIAFDFSTHTPIKNVKVQIKDSRNLATTNDIGIFNLSIEHFPVKLVISHMSYETTELYVKDAMNLLNVALTLRVNYINEVTITSEPTIKKIEIGKLLWALDYEFIDDNILLLASKNVVLGSHLLLLLNEDGDTISSKIVSKNTQKLKKDCLGNVYIIEKEYASKLSLINNHIALFPSISLNEFRNTIEPCVSSSDDRLYYKELYAESYAVNYYIYNKEDKKSKLFKTIVDTQGIRLYKAEQEYLASISDPFALFVEQAFATKILFKPINAPLVNNDEQLFIFNFPQSKLEEYSLNGILRNKISIDFYEDKSCKKQLITDEYSNKIYAIYAKSGKYWVNEISLNTGKTIKEIHIPDHFFVDNIKIYRETLYFLYRDRAVYENLALYEMKL